jgi:hypothetical protein
MCIQKLTKVVVTNTYISDSDVVTLLNDERGSIIEDSQTGLSAPRTPATLLITPLGEGD